MSRCEYIEDTMAETCEHAQVALDLPPQVQEGRQNVYPLIGKLLTEVIPPAVERMVGYTESHPEEVREHVYSIPIDTISNRTAHLPPDDEAFVEQVSRLTETGLTDSALQCELERICGEYWLPHIVHSKTPGDHAVTEAAQQQLVKSLHLWIKDGGVIDSDGLALNRATFRCQVSRGYETLCQTAAAMRSDYGNPFNEKFRGFDYINEVNDESLIATLGIGNQVAWQVRAPIGYYGPSAKSSLRATIFMMHYLWQDPVLRKDIGQRLNNPDHPSYDRRYYDVFRHHTLRANARTRWGSLEESVIAGIVEGAMSVHSVRHLRTAEMAPGYESQGDYLRLVDDMAQQGSANDTTVRASLSLAGLSERQGRFMKGLSGLTISHEARRTLARIRKHAVSEIYKEWAEFGELYAEAQKEHGWKDYFDYLNWLTGTLASAAFEGAVEIGASKKEDHTILRPPVRTGMQFCPVADPRRSGSDAITSMEQAFPELLKCVREEPRRPVKEVAVPRHAFRLHPIGVAS